MDEEFDTSSDVSSDVDTDVSDVEFDDTDTSDVSDDIPEDDYSNDEEFTDDTDGDYKEDTDSLDEDVDVENDDFIEDDVETEDIAEDSISEIEEDSETENFDDELSDVDDDIEEDTEDSDETEDMEPSEEMDEIEEDTEEFQETDEETVGDDEVIEEDVEDVTEDAVTETEEDAAENTATETEEVVAEDTATETEEGTAEETTTDTEEDAAENTATETEEVVAEDTATETEEGTAEETTTDTEEDAAENTATETEEVVAEDTATETEEGTAEETTTDTEEDAAENIATEMEEVVAEDTATETEEDAVENTATETEEVVAEETATDTEEDAAENIATETEEVVAEETATDTEEGATEETATETEEDVGEDATTEIGEDVAEDTMDETVEGTAVDTGTETTDKTSFEKLSEYMNEHNYGPDNFETYSQDPVWRTLHREVYPDYEMPELSQENARTQLSEYMNEHNYGIDDFETYSKDPVWQELHKTLYPEFENPNEPDNSPFYNPDISAPRESPILTPDNNPDIGTDEPRIGEYDVPPEEIVDIADTEVLEIEEGVTEETTAEYEESLADIETDDEESYKAVLGRRGDIKPDTEPYHAIPNTERGPDQVPISDTVENDVIDEASKDEFDVDVTDTEKMLRRDELDLLKSGNETINKRLEAQADDYRDKGLSEDEIRDKLAADKWVFQKEFLEDAFSGQDVSPNVFNGISKNGSKERLDEINESKSLRNLLSDKRIERNINRDILPKADTDMKEHIRNNGLDKYISNDKLEVKLTDNTKALTPTRMQSKYGDGWNPEIMGFNNGKKSFVDISYGADQAKETAIHENFHQLSANDIQNASGDITYRRGLSINGKDRGLNEALTQKYTLDVMRDTNPTYSNPYCAYDDACKFMDDLYSYGNNKDMFDQAYFQNNPDALRSHFDKYGGTGFFDELSRYFDTATDPRYLSADRKNALSRISDMVNQYKISRLLV